VNTPLITAEAVRRTLRSVASGSIPPDDPLLSTTIVSERLAVHGDPPTAESTAWELANLLEQVVARNLVRLRGPDGPPLDQDRSQTAARAALTVDFAASDREREAWSVVYYHYLAPLPLQVKEIAAVVSPGSPSGLRHVGRRLHQGAMSLAAALRAIERAANDRARLGLRSSDSTVPSFRGHPYPVPQWRTSFTGRDDEVVAAAASLGPGAMLTIVGPPGIGKTRFAAVAAAAVAERFPDGVVFLDLTRIDDWETLPGTLVEVLEVPPDPQRSVAATLVQGIGCHRTLLLLDNCEHVLEMSARFAHELLSACSQMAIVATSREPLRIDGERIWRLSGLALPEADSRPTAATILQYPATALFIERALAADQSFRVTDSNAGAVAAICRQLEGLPLAIELVAVRVGAIPVDLLAQRIDEALAFTGTSQRLPGRGPETLRDTVMWSHRLLSPAQQGLFCRLAAFADSWSLPAAEAVCAGDIVPAEGLLGHYAALVDKSLVVLAAEAPEVRYRFVEPVRQAARDLLNQCACLPGTRDRFIGHYVALAEEAEAALGGPDEDGWLDRLQLERANFGGAIRWTREKPDPEAGLRLAAALSGYALLTGRLVDCRRLLDAQLALADSETDPRLVTKGLERAAEVAREQGDLDAAHRYAERARRYGVQMRAGVRSSDLHLLPREEV
jgi:predicted ATPase